MAATVTEQNNIPNIESPVEKSKAKPFAVVVEFIAWIMIAFSAIGIVSSFAGQFVYSEVPFLDHENVQVDSQLNFPVDFGDRLAWVDGTNGTVDAATGLPPAEFAGPLESTIAFPSASGSQKVVFATAKSMTSVLLIAVAWPIRKVATAVRKGENGSAQVARRLWQLSLVVAVVGMAQQVLPQVADVLLISESAAADFTIVDVNVTFLPIILAAVIAMFAALWSEQSAT